VPHNIYSIATLYCTALFCCAILHIQYSYTVLYHHVQLWLTKYRVQLHSTLAPVLLVPHYIYSIATLYCSAMFCCATLHIQYCYTLLYRHVQLYLTTYTVKLHCTVPPYSAVPHYIYSKATLYCAAIFSWASLHIQYSYTVLYRHVRLCLTTYTV